MASGPRPSIGRLTERARPVLPHWTPRGPATQSPRRRGAAPCPHCGRHPEGAAGPWSLSAGTVTAGGGTARAIHRSSITCTGSMTGTRPIRTKSSSPATHSSRVSAWTLYRMVTGAVWRQGVTSGGGIGERACGGPARISSGRGLRRVVGSVPVGCAVPVGARLTPVLALVSGREGAPAVADPVGRRLRAADRIRAHVVGSSSGRTGPARCGVAPLAESDHLLRLPPDSGSAWCQLSGSASS